MRRVGWALALLAIVVALYGLSIATRRPSPVIGPGTYLDLEFPGSDLRRMVIEEEFVRAFVMATKELRAVHDAHGPGHPDFHGGLHRLGTIAHLADDQDTATQTLEIALALRRNTLGSDHPAVAATLYRLALVARYLGNRAESERWYEEAARIVAKTDDPRHLPLRASIVHGQASWLRRVDPTESVAKYREALALRRSALANPSLDVADNLTWLHHFERYVDWASGDRAEAAEAEGILRDLGLPEHSNMAVLEKMRAVDALLAERTDEAAGIFERNIAARVRTREKYPPGFPRRKVPPVGAEVLAWIRIQQGREQEAWRLQQRYSGILHREFLAIGRWQEIDPDSFAGVEDLRRRFLDRRRRFELSLTEETAETPDWKALLDHLEARAELYRREQDYLKRSPIPEPDLARLQAALGAGTAYVGMLNLKIGTTIHSSDGPTFAARWRYVVRPDRPLQWVRIWETDDLSEYRERARGFEKYRKLLNHAQRWKLRVEWGAEVDEIARDVTRQEIDPVLPYLDGIDRLIIEGLGETSLASMIDDRGDYLNDRFSISYVPSAATFLFLSELSGRESERALVVGDPAYAEPAESELPRLPATRTEARNVASQFQDVTLLLGESASESRIDTIARKDELLNYDVVHFATHAVTDRRPQRCAIVLATPSDPEAGDGRIETEEILYGWELDANVLTLSGCHTATGIGQHFSEHVGFSQVLLAAGARSFVSSLWQVEDRATSVLMQRFYENLTGSFDGERGGRTGPLSADLALQEARRFTREYRDADGNQPFRHPVYWDGFVLFGAPRDSFEDSRRAQSPITPGSSTSRDSSSSDF